MDADTQTSTWMPSSSQQPAETLTFDLQNLIRSSVGANEDSLSVLLKLFKAFMTYRDNSICPDERTNKRSGRTAPKHNVFTDTVGHYQFSPGSSLVPNCCRHRRHLLRRRHSLGCRDWQMVSSLLS